MAVLCLWGHKHSQRGNGGGGNVCEDTKMGGKKFVRTQTLAVEEMFVGTQTLETQTLAALFKCQT